MVRTSPQAEPPPQPSCSFFKALKDLGVWGQRTETWPRATRSSGTGVGWGWVAGVLGSRSTSVTPQNVVRGRAASCGGTDSVHPGVSGTATGSPADEASPGQHALHAQGEQLGRGRRSEQEPLLFKPRAGRGNKVLCGSPVQCSLDTAPFVCPEAIPRVPRAVFFVSPGQLCWTPCRVYRARSPAGAALSREPCRPGRGTRGPRPVAPVVPALQQTLLLRHRCLAPGRVLQ